PEHIGKLVAAAKEDPEHGIFYAFAFLAGTRPSEQLGLLWSEVDFDKNIIRIRRIQERDGTLTEMTKTEAGKVLEKRHLTTLRKVPVPAIYDLTGGHAPYGYLPATHYRTHHA